MKVVVLGAGVIGVSTAFHLARLGAEVEVIERQPGPALETSWGNAGQISPGYSTPWAAPGLVWKAMRWLFERDAPLAIRPDGTLFQWEWVAALLSQCTPERYAVNKERMMRLAGYSRDVLRELRHETGVAYEHRTGGTLQVFRTEAQTLAVQRDLAVLRQCGVAHEWMGPDELSRAEPALAQVQHRLTGGLRLPDDETGDCHLFTQALTRQAEALGVRFHWGHELVGVQLEGGRAVGVHVRTPTGRHTRAADRVVLALGSYSRAVGRTLGLELPVYPVKGYSLTIPLRDETRAPVSTVLDESFKVAVTRFDQRLRVGGMAELSGFDLQLRAHRRATLERVVQDLFPGAGEIGGAHFWTGLRPMTPDGTPIVGACGVEGLYLNTGHGTLGWTMACGSGRLVADQVMGRAPEIDPEGLSLARYRSPVRVWAGTRVAPHPG